MFLVSLKNAVVDVLQGYPQTKAVLMRYHGALCMGTDEEDAFLAARELERVCREQIGLPGIPPTVLSNDKAKADLDKILTLTGFDKITE